MTKYGAFGEKMNYGKKILGVIRSTFVIGPTGIVEHAWYGIHADGHAARVLATLQR
jgi:peroxiredoxin Q/BCP